MIVVSKLHRWANSRSLTARGWEFHKPASVSCLMEEGSMMTKPPRLSRWNRMMLLRFTRSKLEEWWKFIGLSFRLCKRFCLYLQMWKIFSNGIFLEDVSRFQFKINRLPLSKNLFRFHKTKHLFLVTECNVAKEKFSYLHYCLKIVFCISSFSIKFFTS